MGRFFSLVLIGGTLVHTATAREAPIRPQIPVIIGGDAGYDACSSNGVVVGLDPNGDGCESAPREHPFFMLDQGYTAQSRWGPDWALIHRYADKGASIAQNFGDKCGRVRPPRRPGVISTLHTR